MFVQKSTWFKKLISQAYFFLDLNDFNLLKKLYLYTIANTTTASVAVAIINTIAPVCIDLKNIWNIKITDGMNMHMIYCNTIPLVEKSLNSMSRLILITANAMMQIVINAHKQKSRKRNGFFSNMMTIQPLIIIDVHSHILNSNFVLSCIFITNHINPLICSISTS